MTEPSEYITGRTVQEQMDQLISYVDTRAAEVATETAAEAAAEAITDYEERLSTLEEAAVLTTGNQTIAGVKTFSEWPAVMNATPGVNLKSTAVTIGTAPSGTTLPAIALVDSAGTAIGYFMWRISNTDIRGRIIATDPTSGKEGELRLTVSSGGVALQLRDNTAGTSTTIATL